MSAGLIAARPPAETTPVEASVELQLEQGRVGVWSFRATPDSGLIPSLCASLSDDDIRDVGQLRRHADRLRMVAGRGGARVILGRYLGVPPHSVEIVRESGGKPRLADSYSRRLNFNVSHSGSVALVAVVDNCEIGIDVEQIRPEMSASTLGGRVFSRSEQAILTSLPGASREAVAFAGWVRKEAYLKAIGTGLSNSPRDVEVFFAGGSGADSPRFVEVVDGFSLIGIDMGSDYAAAIAIELPSSRDFFDERRSCQAQRGR